MLERAYRMELREAGVQGESILCVLIDDRGETTQIRVAESAGDPRLDAAAMEVAEAMRFRPAEAAGRPVAVKWTIPVTFRVR